MLRQTEGCSGAEVVSMCQEAALLTMKDDINAPFVSYNEWFPPPSLHINGLKGAATRVYHCNKRNEETNNTRGDPEVSSVARLDWSPELNI
jgi:hypothetical protein